MAGPAAGCEVKRRILYLVNAFEPDAPTRLMAEVARAAKESGGFECHVAALSRGGAFEPELRAFADSVRLIGMGAVWQLSSLASLARWIRELQPDIFHATLTRPILLGVPIAAASRARAAVITQHGLHEWREGGAWLAPFAAAAFRFAARRANAIVSVSKASAGELAGRLPRQLAARFRVVPNGVDPNVFHPVSQNARRKVVSQLFPHDEAKQDRLLVGAAGNLRRIKGHHTFVKAAVLLAQELPSARFAVWGEGPERPLLEAEIGRAGMSHKFVLPGRCAAMAEAIAACSVFVQPSLSESFGLAAAEAMSCGVPVVASEAGGLPELIENGKTGLLFAPGSAEGLAVLTATLLRDPARRQAMGEAGRERILECFTIGRMTASYLDLYEQLLAAK